MDYRKGQLVCSRAGRDKGLFLAVLGTAGDRVLVADGKEHRLAKPKVKNEKHLSQTNKTVSESALTSDKLLSMAIAELTAPLPTT